MIKQTEVFPLNGFKITTHHKKLNPFSETHLNKMIPLLENEIRQTMKEIGIREPVFRELEKDYIEKKTEYETLKSHHDCLKDSLDILVRMKTNKKDDEEYRLMRSTSHVDDKKPKKKVGPVRWADLTVKVLTDTNSFITKEEVYDRISCISEVKSFLNPLPKKKQTQIRNTFYHNLERAATLVKKPKIVFYENKIGLIDWCTDDNRPEREYLKTFLFNNNKQPQLVEA